MGISPAQQKVMDAVNQSADLVHARTKALEAVINTILTECQHNQDLTANLSQLASVVGGKRNASLIAGQLLGDIAWPGGIDDR